MKTTKKQRDGLREKSSIGSLLNAVLDDFDALVEFTQETAEFPHIPDDDLHDRKSCRACFAINLLREGNGYQ